MSVPAPRQETNEGSDSGNSRGRAGERWPQRTERRRAVLVGAVALLAVTWPLGRDIAEDSFPLSNYPMFTHDPPRLTGFVRAIGVTGDGREVGLDPRIIGGTVEVIHAAQTLSTAIRQGRAVNLCAEIGERSVGVVEVLIVTERYDIIDGLRADEPDAVSRDVHASCRVDVTVEG